MIEVMDITAAYTSFAHCNQSFGVRYIGDWTLDCQSERRVGQEGTHFFDTKVAHPVKHHRWIEYGTGNRHIVVHSVLFGYQE